MIGVWSLGLAHGLSDAAAGFAIGLILLDNGASAGLWIFLYNGLAFALQPLAGLILDRLDESHRGAAFGLALTAGGLGAFPFDPRPGILLIGLGSAFFHAGGGAVSILHSPGRASGPGIFSAFGVMGLVIGTRLSFIVGSSILPFFATLLAGLSIGVVFIRGPLVRPAETPASWFGFEIPIMVIITAFGLRSLVWSGVNGEVDGTDLLAISIGVSAGIGKLAGGFLSDRVGWLEWTVMSLAGAAFLIALAGEWAVPFLVGVFLLQSITGLTISWLGQILPESPAFAASLALGAAVILGGLPFAFSSGTWFGPAAIMLALAASLLGYWFVLREGMGRARK